MSASLQISSLTLRVPALARSLDFYVRQLGFAIAQHTAARAELAPAAGVPPILTLLEDPSALAPPRDAAGLFHAALLLPSRSALGAWLHFAAENGVEFQGFSDHGVSEALYFTDPAGNGLEFYADRPRESWPFAPDGEVAMFTHALDVPSLLEAGKKFSGHDADDASDAKHGGGAASPLRGARWGHVHLRVADLDRSEEFYRRTLGLALTQGSYPGARFLAADGYHHHLGLNIWGHPRRPQPPGALGLAETVFTRMGESTARELRDPDGIALRITAPKNFPASS
ncbi:MAG TPA: VOC family protein [Opitutaceae bacterium]|nr:VOC family protein [Opitutaceae bacterium]